METICHRYRQARTPMTTQRRSSYLTRKPCLPPLPLPFMTAGRQAHTVSRLTVLPFGEHLAPGHIQQCCQERHSIHHRPRQSPKSDSLIATYQSTRLRPPLISSGSLTTIKHQPWLRPRLAHSRPTGWPPVSLRGRRQRVTARRRFRAWRAQRSGTERAAELARSHERWPQRRVQAWRALRTAPE